MDATGLTDLHIRVLVALVEGYRARDGMKDRLRALNEWEIARRAGLTEVSYVEYMEHPTRNDVMAALGALQTRGLASIWERGVKYDTFAPTERGMTYLDGGSVEEGAPAAVADEAEVAKTPDGTELTAIVERLDEIIRLLRSLDSKLGGV